MQPNEVDKEEARWAAGKQRSAVGSRRVRESCIALLETILIEESAGAPMGCLLCFSVHWMELFSHSRLATLVIRLGASYSGLRRSVWYIEATVKYDTVGFQDLYGGNRDFLMN